MLSPSSHCFVMLYQRSVNIIVVRLRSFRHDNNLSLYDTYTFSIKPKMVYTQAHHSMNLFHWWPPLVQFGEHQRSTDIYPGSPHSSPSLAASANIRDRGHVRASRLTCRPTGRITPCHQYYRHFPSPFCIQDPSKDELSPFSQNMNHLVLFRRLYLTCPSLVAGSVATGPQRCQSLIIKAPSSLHFNCSLHPTGRYIS